MLPSLGLFKSIPCPLYPKCYRDPCFYSHKTQRSSTIKDRPAETIKRQKRPIETNKAKVKTTEVSKNEPFILSLIPNAKPSPQTKAQSLPATSAESITNMVLKSVAMKPKAPVSSTSKPMSAIEARKRTAHTPTFKSEPTGPPVILPNIKSTISLKVRQLIASKLFAEFKRIYEPILKNKPTLATEHAKLQEERILSTTSNEPGYKQLAAATLMHLKKRPLSAHDDDIGIDGEWKDPKEESDKNEWLNSIGKCVASLDTLKSLGYPLPDILTSSPAPDPLQEMVGTIHSCDRCNQEYMIKAVLQQEDMESCVYHPMRTKMSLVDGVKQKVYRCCEDPLGSVGCKRGPHVYKDEDNQILHQKIPFVKVPAKGEATTRQKMVALDCEMGYTTIGMELIRLTAVNEKMEVLLDELVLPCSMIVDLNTVFSGIKTLEGVKHDLDSVRKELFKYVDADTIILGHGLENDMNALRIIHTNVIDTVDLFPHKQGLPYRNSLKALASSHLKKFIQTGTEGHDSLEDARSCVELLELYVKKVLPKKLKMNPLQSE